MIIDGKQKKNIDRAVELILSGDVVGFPTETVYGLGADAHNISAVKKIFEIKQRPDWDPLIVHVAGREQLETVVEELPPIAVKLIEKFWPGPLTIVLKKKTSLPSEVTSGLEAVAVRMPRHLIALALIKNSNKAIAAPSANQFQGLSPTTARAVEKSLGKKVSVILDGGPCLVGVESTVISLLDEPIILRPGGISLEDLEIVLGHKIKINVKSSIVRPVSPGMLDFHYAPQKPLRYFDAKGLTEFVKKRGIKKNLSTAALVCFSNKEVKKFENAGFKNIFPLSIVGNYDEASRNLFSTLREIDESEFNMIYALAFPEERLGVAINDRLKKAQHEGR
ncbi:MAG: L-threonylcarbamoyladenylate synthase [Oligoflexia bacterium]|nr:L-threonylcarbamoyladenylate synthase [Oligoflexia bacterium]